MNLFDDDKDYEAFERVLAEARERAGMRVCAYALMPNHFHLVLWPRKDGDLSRFMQWLTMTHTQRWHAHRHRAGHGHLYQSHFKSFPIQANEHFLSVCRHVERNALRAKLVKRAEAWVWCSLACREGKLGKGTALLDDGPVDRPRRWRRLVNEPQSKKELDRLHTCLQRGQPYDDEAWTRRTAVKLGLESSLRPVGRPRKVGEKAA
ncbi:MAG: transposase [Phycisphaerae bacterium]|nr:transposase [Phycisphaerae bacterium]